MPSETARSHDALIGEAYVNGLFDARGGDQPHNPYYENSEQWVAYNSGYRDQMARQAGHDRIR